MYAGYYVALEPIAGTTWTGCMGVPMCLTATAFQAAAAPDAWKWALGKGRKWFHSLDKKKTKKKDKKKGASFHFIGTHSRAVQPPSDAGGETLEA